MSMTMLTLQFELHAMSQSQWQWQWNVNVNVDIAIACNVKLRWKVDMDQLRKRLFLRLGALQLRSWAAESELLDEPQLAARFPWAYGTLQRDSNHRPRKVLENSAAREHTNWSRWLKEPALLEPSWCGSRGRRIESPVNSVGRECGPNKAEVGGSSPSLDIFFALKVSARAPLPTHQVSASESHVVPRNDLVKLATPPALQVRSCRTYFTRYPVEPSTRAATYEAQDSENGLWRESKWISMRIFWDGHSAVHVAVGMVIMNNN